MSLQTWKDEFYPIPVEKTTKATALRAVIRKWEGLRQESLDKHGVLAGVNTVTEKGPITSNSPLPFPIHSVSCAFCYHYLDFEEKSCSTCPLYQIRGGYACDDETPEEEEEDLSAPWYSWWRRQDPEPMLRWLYKIRDGG